MLSLTKNLNFIKSFVILHVPSLKVRLINEVTGCQGSPEARVDRCIIYFAFFLLPNMLLEVIFHSPLLLFSCSSVAISQEFCGPLRILFKRFAEFFTKFCDLYL